MTAPECFEHAVPGSHVKGGLHLNQELHDEYKSFDMLVNLHILDTRGAGGELVKPPIG